jgi:hypothetical protein
MKMTERFVNHGIRILAAVVLLAMMSSPIRPTRASHAAPSRNYLPRKLAKRNHGYSGESAISARPSLREADPLQFDIKDELDADIEAQLTVKSPPSALSFAVLPSPSPDPHSERVSFTGAMAVRPLRC